MNSNALPSNYSLTPLPLPDLSPTVPLCIPTFSLPNPLPFLTFNLDRSAICSLLARSPPDRSLCSALVA